MKFSNCAIGAALLSLAGPSAVSGFAPAALSSTPTVTRTTFLEMSTASRSSDADFAAFADTLEEEKETTSSRRRRTTTTTNNNNSKSLDSQTWQASVDELLDPLTPLSRRQALVAKLVNSNKDIQESVVTALRDRKIDGLLTPNGKKLQDGTQSVARQIANDILPNLAKTTSSMPPNPVSILPDPTDLSKVGSRILNAFQNQLQKNVEQLQGDLANPVRIPERISRQTEDFLTETRNVFSETPVGLEGPAYTVVSSTDSYEIRDYEGYTVASTSMGKGVILDGDYEPQEATMNLAETGAAFNTLAAYLFGANKQGESMEMTTPVTTTSWGEMRFFLSPKKAMKNGEDNIPEPLDDASESLYQSGAVTILDIPPARLAVKKFTGFVTEGEITRQKDALLSALMMDDVELDVAHGDPISHVIFQYNPPYTLPIVRRNEIAVAVRSEDDTEDLQKQWTDEDEEAELSSVNGAAGATPTAKSAAAVARQDDIAPSDV